MVLTQKEIWEMAVEAAKAVKEYQDHVNHYFVKPMKEQENRKRMEDNVENISKFVKELKNVPDLFASAIAEDLIKKINVNSGVAFYGDKDVLPIEYAGKINGRDLNDKDVSEAIGPFLRAEQEYGDLLNYIHVPKNSPLNELTEKEDVTTIRLNRCLFTGIGVPKAEMDFYAQELGAQNKLYENLSKRSPKPQEVFRKSIENAAKVANEYRKENETNISVNYPLLARILAPKNVMHEWEKEDIANERMDTYGIQSIKVAAASAHGTAQFGKPVLEMDEMYKQEPIDELGQKVKAAWLSHREITGKGIKGYANLEIKNGDKYSVEYNPDIYSLKAKVYKLPN